jgi:hypothetical protein
MLLWLDELETQPGPLGSLYFPAGATEPDIAEAWQTTFPEQRLPEDLPGLMGRSPHGTAIFQCASGAWLVLPPFPITNGMASLNVEVGPLRALLQRDYVVLLALVRLGAYAIGVYQGLLALAADAGTGNIHARHRNGGWSQARFDRHRQKQMETFFSRVCQHTRQLVSPYSGQIDFVAYGGERQTLLAFRKQCEFLQGLKDRTMVPLVPVGEPRRAALPEAIRQVWMSKIIPLPLEGGPIGEAASERPETT